MVDHFAEPVRAELIPGFHYIQKIAIEEGAIGCGISGSGPSLFALCDSLEVSSKVGSAMVAAFKKSGLKSKAYSSAINTNTPQII